MKCAQVRELFGAYWDDETTQAERENLEAHFAACDGCREAYEQFSRVLELTGSLPRLEAAPDLVERVLARARRVKHEPDRLPQAAPRWVAATAAAALVVLTAVGVSPWMRLALRPAEIARTTPPLASEPVLVALRAGSGMAPPGTQAESLGGATRTMIALSDSLFDHSEDVEFILDPVTLRRGHAHAVTSAPSGVRTERAVVSF